MTDEELEAQLTLRGNVQRMVNRLVQITEERLSHQIDSDAAKYGLTDEQKLLRESALNVEETQIVQILGQIAQAFLQQQGQ